MLKMITFMFPCRARKLDPTTAKEARGLLVQVFHENNSKLRTQLFSDPLIKFLWSEIFVVRAPDTLVNYLRFVKSTKEHGDIQIDRFV